MKPYTLTIIVTILSLVALSGFIYFAYTTHGGERNAWMSASIYNVLYLSTKIKFNIKPLDV